MADTFLEKCTRCAKVCGLLFLDCAFGMLIGWARKSRSHGTEREFVFLHFSTFVWIENDGESVKPTQTSPNERLLQTLWDFTDRDCDNLESRREQQRHLHFVGTLFYLVSKQTRFVAFLRRHIVKERGVVQIESLMFDEHEMIKRAATECMCNMILCEEVSSSPAYRPLARP